MVNITKRCGASPCMLYTRSAATRTLRCTADAKAKQFDTEASPVVPDQSTNSAQSCLTSVCRWERVYSRCYDRTILNNVRVHVYICCVSGICLVRRAQNYRAYCLAWTTAYRTRTTPSRLSKARCICHSARERHIK